MEADATGAFAHRRPQLIRGVPPTTRGQEDARLKWNDEYQPWWFLGSILIGLAAGDIAFAAFRPVQDTPLPAWIALVFVPVMAILAVRETNRRFRAALLTGIAYFVAGQVPPSLLASSVVALGCAILSFLTGALFLSGGWAFVGRGTRLGGATVALIAAGVRLAVLSNWEAMLRHYPRAG